MSHKEYMEEKRRIAAERNCPVGQVGIFEPFPPSKRPYGREDLILDFIKLNKISQNKDALCVAENALKEELSLEDQRARVKRMGKTWTQEMKDKLKETQEKKKEAANEEKSDRDGENNDNSDDF